jgi:succinate dehydrogenase / fumarate reductase cytochrome b subunit
VISLWLITLSVGIDGFMMISMLLSSVFGKLIMLGFAFSLYYHFLNGIRHLIWDTGHGIDLDFGRLSGHACGITSIVLVGITALFLF